MYSNRNTSVTLLNSRALTLGALGFRCIGQAGIEEGEKKAARTISEIESTSAPVVDAEPAEKKEEETEKA